MRPSLAVILAAGLGVRLGPAGREMPKGFIRLGSVPIVEESIRKLLSVGIERFLIVTGHRREYYDRLQESYGDFVSTCHNPDFAATGSLFSLSLAIESVDAPIILLESDIVYERLALTKLMAASATDALLVSGPTASGDEVYVQATNGVLRNASKDAGALGPEIVGEWVGISRLSAACLREIATWATPRLAVNRKLDYEHALVGASVACPIHCLRISDLAWAEIDDDRHLSRARSVVYPAILARDGSE